MPSLTAAINEAQRMCWDESIGYTFGGDVIRIQTDMIVPLLY